MVSGVSSIRSFQYQPRELSSTSMTDDQKSLLEEILAKYDSDNMTSDSMKSMMDEIKEAGITPSKDLRDTMDAAGFKPPEKPQGPPPDDQTSGVQEELPQYLLDFIEKEEGGSVSQSDIDSLVKSLQSSGKMTEGVLVDQKV